VAIRRSGRRLARPPVRRRSGGGGARTRISCN
jgi:hypothetical protein